jgi:tRNA(Ile)-lysidine synthase
VVVSLQAHIQQSLTGLALQGQTVLTAFSGGLDSRVLLELLVRLQSTLGYQLKAIYVHHGLSENAGAWAEFCQNTCLTLNVPFKVAHVVVDKTTGLGVEAAARQARYEALAVENADFIALAHHQNDQAETFLLQLFRGAGVKGLSAMMAIDTQRRLIRPLLDVPRSQLVHCAESLGLQWIEDESNQDTHFDRNFIRKIVLPAIEQGFAHVSVSLARTAHHMSEAASLLDELAELDVVLCHQNQQLNLSELAKLSLPRAKNVIRYWLISQQYLPPSAARLQEMLDQLLGAKLDANLKVAIGGGKGAYLRRYRNLAYIENDAPQTTIELVWQGEPELCLPDGSRLTFQRKIGEGLAEKRLGIHTLRITQRSGGERFKPVDARPTRTLKHLLQEANVPPWQRGRIPLIYSDDCLAIVPLVGIASHMQATSTEEGLIVDWHF